LAVVVELAPRSELAPERLAEPEAIVGAGLTPELVSLAGWMAREYCSTPSRALSLMLAPGTAEGAGAKRALVAELTEAGRDALVPGGERLSDRQRALLQQLAERGASATAAL